MSWIGDFRLGDTFDTKCCTVSTTGAPTTLAGSPVISAYVGNSTTQLTAGITLSVDFDGVTGLHNIRVVASSGNGYATASNYQLVITTGTVGGTSVVGYVVAEFSIENRRADVQFWNGTQVATPATAGIPDVNVKNIDNDAASASGTVTFPNATLASTTNITAGTITTVTNLTNAPTAGDLTATMKTSVTTAATAATPTIAGTQAFNNTGTWTGNVTGNLSGSVGSVTGAVGSVTGAVGSVTARVTANTDQLAGQTVTAAAGVTFPTSVASPTNITAGTITTVTNVTNAATAGDFTATMKTSIGTAVAASAVASVTGAVGSVTGSVGSVVGAVGSVTGNVGGNVVGSVASVTALAANSVTASVLAADAVNEIADGILDRNMATGTDSGSASVRTMRQALRFLRNKWSIAAGTLTITKEDDTTASWTGAVTTSAGNPLSEIDPAS